MSREDEIDKMIDEEISGEEGRIAESEIEWISCDDLPEKKKTSKKKYIIYDVVRYAIMTVALIVFGYASYELTLIYVESKEAEDIKNEASNMFLVDLDSLTENDELPTDADGNPIDINNNGDGKLFIFDYKKMLEYNSEAKGYIRQGNGEYIDNPIVQHSDNDYYLDHLVNHEKSTVGSIFIDYNIEEGLEAKNCIIYGHNIGERAGRIMFGSLNWYYHKTGYYKENPTFDIWIENQRYRYYVFAIYKTDAVGSPVYQYSFSSDEEFMDYVKECKQKSKYQFKDAPAITKDSKIITLSTCTHADEYRMIVQLVRGEKLDVYGNPVNGSKEEGTKKPETSTEKTTTKPAETKPTTKPTVKPTVKPEEKTTPATTKPTTTKPTTTKPADTKPTDTKPTETKPTETKPEETTSKTEETTAKPQETPSQEETTPETSTTQQETTTPEAETPVQDVPEPEA